MIQSLGKSLFRLVKNGSKDIPDVRRHIIKNRRCENSPGSRDTGLEIPCIPVQTSKAHYQAFFGVLIDLIVDHLVLIIKPFDNQTES